MICRASSLECISIALARSRRSRWLFVQWCILCTQSWTLSVSSLLIYIRLLLVPWLICSFSMTMTFVMFACCTIGSVARNLIIINTRAEMYARARAPRHARTFHLCFSVSNIRGHCAMIMMTVKAMINFLFYQIWHFAASGCLYYQFHSSCHAICFRLRFLSLSLFSLDTHTHTASHRCFVFPRLPFSISNIHC